MAHPEDSPPAKAEWKRDPYNARYLIDGVELEYSDGALRGYAAGQVAFAIPTALIMHIIAGGPVRRTVG